MAQQIKIKAKLPNNEVMSLKFPQRSTVEQVKARFQRSVLQFCVQVIYGSAFYVAP
jgi:hypothetical protein